MIDKIMDNPFKKICNKTIYDRHGCHIGNPMVVNDVPDISIKMINQKPKNTTLQYQHLDAQHVMRYTRWQSLKN